MKCQMCGKSEVNFHYSSNINGCVTETNLCSECAANSGHDLSQFYNTNIGNMFNGFFPVFGGGRGMQQFFMPVMGLGMPLRTMATPLLNTHANAEACECGCGCGKENEAPPTELDNEMQKRRELYMEMRAAADSEDYEKAAQLRDQIKEIEANNTEKTAQQENN